jgi:hypothetical protein
MSRKLKPDPKQRTLDSFFIPPPQVDSFLSQGSVIQSSLNPQRVDPTSVSPGFNHRARMIQQAALDAARAETEKLAAQGYSGQAHPDNFLPKPQPVIRLSLSPDAQREIEAADAAAAANQAAADAANQAAAIAANQDAAARDARAVARAQIEQDRLGPEVSTQVGAIYSPSPTRSQGGSGRMNKMNFLTFRGRHKSKKSKRKSKKNKIQKKKTRRSRGLK